MRRKLTQDEVIKRITKINPHIKLIGVYNNSHEKVEFECLKCGHRWMALPINIFKGKSCPKCTGHLKVTKDEAIDRLRNIHMNIEIIGEYIDTNTKTKCRCNVCGHIWFPQPKNLFQGYGCPQCGRKKASATKTIDKEEIIDRIKNVNTNIEIVGDYVNTHTPVECRCSICGNEWFVTASHILQGEGCPICASSKLERNIKSYLDSNNILYEQQYRIDECKYKRKLPFDFAIFNDDSLLCLIEADGKQHFNPSQFGGISKEQAQKNFEQLKIRDNIKNTYCKENNIKLLRIPYWEIDNIEQILDKEFKN